MRMLLVGFGFTVFFGCIAAALVPYLMGRRHLVTSFGIFLAGCANFIGYSSVHAGWYWEEFDSARYVTLSDASIAWFIAGATLFLGTLYWSYEAGSTFLWRKLTVRIWPSTNGREVGKVVVAATAVTLIAGFLLPNIQGVAQILAITGQLVVIFAFCLAFYLWYRERTNFLAGLLMLTIGAVAAVAALSSSAGRRPLFSLVLAVPIVIYWTRGIYASRGQVCAVISAVLLMGLLTIAGYSTFRHADNEAYVALDRNQRILFALERLQRLPSALIDPNVLFRTQLLGGDAVPCSLLAIELVEVEDRWSKDYLHAIKYVFTNPVPRAFWGNKPEALGQILPRDLGQWARGYVNWGPGIVGHGFYDGGIWVLALYGFLLGTFMRWFDSQLVADPQNPYLIALLASFSGQWVAFPRGDIGVFTIQVIGAFLGAYAVVFAIRFTSRTSPRFSPTHAGA